MGLVEKVGTDYSSFGVMLLQDSSGEKICAIEKEKRGNVADINREILRLWLQGKGKQPVTWNTLTTVLADIMRDDLAKMISSIIVNPCISRSNSC